MKKSLIVVLVAVMCAVSFEAQAKWLGVKAGANISSLSDFTSDAWGSVKNSSNFQGGVVFNFGLGKKDILALQPEVLLSFRDAKLNGGFFEQKSVTLNTTRLEVPVNLQAGLNLGKIARVFVQAGPYFTYILSDNTNTVKQTMSEIGAVVTDFDINKFEWGIGLGAGVNLFTFQLSAKYDFGISEFKSGNAANIWNGMKDRNFSLSLAWFFL